MKRLFIGIVFLMFVAIQAGVAYTITPEDVQICFPYVNEAGETIRDWHFPKIVSISYSDKPVGEHSPIAKFGELTIEVQMQGKDPSQGKGVIKIEVSGTPGATMARMEFRVRVRGVLVGEWSEIEWVDFERPGKPGKPASVDKAPVDA